MVSSGPEILVEKIAFQQTGGVGTITMTGDSANFQQCSFTGTNAWIMTSVGSFLKINECVIESPMSLVGGGSTNTTQITGNYLNDAALEISAGSSQQSLIFSNNTSNPGGTTSSLTFDVSITRGIISNNVLDAITFNAASSSVRSCLLNNNIIYSSLTINSGTSFVFATISKNQIGGSIFMSTNLSSCSICDNILSGITFTGTISQLALCDNIFSGAITMNSLTNAAIVGNQTSGITTTGNIQTSSISGNIVGATGIALGANAATSTIAHNETSAQISTTTSSGTNVVTGNRAQGGWVGTNWTTAAVTNDVKASGLYAAPDGINN